MVEVLRHTGIRIEELTELSHHSLIQYRLPDTGELIPLLQIAPSKTDAERLLVISPELADVLSAIVARIRAGQAARAAGGLLRQERTRLQPAHAAAVPMAPPAGEPAGRRDLAAQLPRPRADRARRQRRRRRSPMRYTFHDFRRLFITDAIMHGMPPHIAQLVAGHRDINTTMGYKAVYPEEVINGHRAFIARRRALRPGEEYRTPTDEEWAEFIGHFEHRKVVRRRLRPLLRHALHPRAQLPALPAAAPRPRRPAPPGRRSATTSSPASPKPNPTAGSAKPKD